MAHQRQNFHVPDACLLCAVDLPLFDEVRWVCVSVRVSADSGWMCVCVSVCESLAPAANSHGLTAVCLLLFDEVTVDNRWVCVGLLSTFEVDT